MIAPALSYRRCKNAFGLFFGFLLCLHLAGQNGNPFITNFPPSDYHSDQYVSGPKNWCTLQSSSGVIFVANQNAILAYNGKQWTVVAGTSGKLFFKMAEGHDGRIYTGGTADLGWIGADSLGGFQYNSMLGKVPAQARDFGRIFNVITEENGNVIFLSSAWLFSWNGQSVKTWKSKNGFQKLFSVGKKTYVQSQNDGLWLIQNNKMEKVPGSDAMNALVIKGIHFKENSAADTLLLFTNKQGVFLFGNQQLQKNTAALDSFIIWNTLELPDGKIALASENNGLCVYDKLKNNLETIDEKKGLFFNSLIYLSSDAEGGIWCSSYMGLNRIDYPSPLYRITAPAQSKIMTLAMYDYKQQLFLGTISGCRVMDPSNSNASMLQLPAMSDQVRAFAPFQDGLLIGSSGNGIYWRKEESQTKVSSYKATALLVSKKQPGRIFVGTAEGLFSLRWDNGKWTEEGRIEGVDQRVYHIEEMPDGDLWVSFDKVSRIHFQNEFHSTLVTAFDSTKGFTPDHTEFEMLQYDGRLFFGTNRGIFCFDDRTQQLIPDQGFGERFADHGHGARHLVTDLLGNIWLYDGKRTGFMYKDDQSNWQWNDLPLRRMEDQEVWSIYPSPDSLIWIGTTTTLYCYNPGIRKNYHTPYRTLIDKVTVNDSEIVFFGNYNGANGQLTNVQPAQLNPVFSFANNDLSFSFAATSFEYPEKTQYSHWLEGMEKNWSAWSTESNQNYSNLHEGVYKFHVRAKNLYDTIGEEAVYAFTIEPPWFRTWWAYIGYFVVAVCFILLLVTWRVNLAIRKQDVERLKELDRQQSMLAATVGAQEQERVRIAKDLHDDIQVLLSAVKLKLSMIRTDLQKKGFENDLTTEPTALVQDAIESVRNISRDLMPVTLSRLGLGVALQDLSEKIDTDNLKVDFRMEGTQVRLEKELELAIFRVCQELFSNSLKHAAASEIQLALIYLPTSVRIDYRDNGKGFLQDASGKNSSGLGLRNMESRISLVGGKFSCTSAPGKGFHFELEVPFQPGSPKQ